MGLPAALAQMRAGSVALLGECASGGWIAAPTPWLFLWLGLGCGGPEALGSGWSSPGKALRNVPLAGRGVGTIGPGAIGPGAA